ncbi:hypothetical protein [Aerolutibacter ruishenii]|uniref:hypothetical protein n=1 Tax=Aerolutibacter ruishenii TaxID=686800 RepID=UPI0011A30F69|nr:hypothetical protein [Lysobacter ruishenii]
MKLLPWVLLTILATAPQASSMAATSAITLKCQLQDVEGKRGDWWLVDLKVDVASKLVNEANPAVVTDKTISWQSSFPRFSYVLDRSSQTLTATAVKSSRVFSGSCRPPKKNRA